MAVRVMFYVQHLLGIGHLRRASLLSAALCEQGLDVQVVLGGRAVPGISFEPATVVHLPPAHVADHTFTPLLGDGDVPVNDAWKDNRRQNLLDCFHAFKPDVVLIEMFPFGRRQFRFELLPLLNAAQAATPRPRVISSVRDILVQKSKPGRVQETVQVVREYFDLVLVHGDSSLVPFEATFPAAETFVDKVRHTGYIAPLVRTQSLSIGRGEVIVSAGGGAVGGPLFKAALAARPLCRWAAHPWRLVTGPNYAQDDFQALVRHAPDGVIVERYRADLPQMLKNCELSISQGGYNTIMDILRARATAIVAPYEDGGESEQCHRARLLAARNIIHVVEASPLTPSTLAHAINQAQPPQGSLADIDLSGAETSARLISECAGTQMTGDVGYG